MSELLLSKELKVIEPLWIMIMSSPALLPVMWKMITDNDMVLVLNGLLMIISEINYLRRGISDTILKESKSLAFIQKILKQKNLGNIHQLSTPGQ